MTATKTPPSPGSTLQTQHQAFVVFTDALAVYLEVIGWKAIVVGTPGVRGLDPAVDKMGRYEFTCSFTIDGVKPPASAVGI